MQRAEIAELRGALAVSEQIASSRGKLLTRARLRLHLSMLDAGRSALQTALDEHTDEDWPAFLRQRVAEIEATVIDLARASKEGSGP